MLCSLLVLPLLQANVRIWLDSIGLSQYQQKFDEDKFKGKDFIKELKQATETNLREDLGITKSGMGHASLATTVSTGKINNRAETNTSSTQLPGSSK